MKTREQEAKKEIARRLCRSNKSLWSNISLEEQTHVVDYYYSLRGIEHLGVDKVLDYNSALYQNAGFLVLGLGMGIFGNLFADIIEKYVDRFPFYGVTDLLVVFAFLLLLWGFITYIESIAASNLADDKVLEYLLNELERDNQSLEK